MLCLMLLRTVVLILACAAGLLAQAGSKQLEIPPAAQAGPGFDAAKATSAYLGTITPEKKQRSDAYFEGGYWLILWDFLYGAAVAIALLHTRVSSRMRDLAEKVSARRWLQTWLYWVLYLVAVFVLTSPLT